MNSVSVNKRKIVAFVYSLLVAAMLVFTLAKLPSVKIDTSVLSLLPKDTISGISEDVEAGYIKRLDSQILLLVKTNNIEKLESFYDELKDSDLFSGVTGRISSDDEKLAYNFLYTYKTSLIDPALRDRLLNTPYEQTVLKKLYSSFSGVSGKELDNDPLLLTRSVGTALSSSSRFALKNGYLCVSDGLDSYYLLSLSLKEHGMDSKSTDAASKIDQIIDEYSGTYFEVYKRGSIFYSAYASTKVANEMNFIGLVAGVGVFVLIYIIFRSLTPLLMTLISVASGLVSGFFFLVYFFESINLIMLGMCLSVIGIVSDYTIYFVTMRMHKAEHENAFTTIDTMKLPLLIAAGTDVIAYVIILLSPVSPLKQLAMFSSATITFSCLFVIVIEPFFFETIKVHTTRLPVFFEKYLSLIAK
ncbi:MAG: MMPL family transporter, partial [Succinivibrio sp.]